MDREELFAFLDMESGEDFQYFENFADFVEHGGVIDGDAVYELVTEIDLKTFAELCESYFYETLEQVPGDQIDVYNLLENIKRVLIGLSSAGRRGEDNALTNLSDQWNRFRLWYSADSSVECRNLSTGEIELLPVRDALLQSRLEKLSGAEYGYDFSDALNFELEEYMMTYADLAEEDES